MKIKDNMNKDKYDKIISLAKRRGILNPSFEIYGGVAGFYSYGPLGSIMKRNIENIWRGFYLFREGFIEIDTPTITPYEVLKASGHVDEFTDLTAICDSCGRYFKAEDIEKDGKYICPVCNKEIKRLRYTNLMFQTKIGVGDERRAFLRPETAQGIFTEFHNLYRFVREKLPFGVIQIGRGYRNEIAPRQGVIRLREFSMAEAEIFFDPENKKHERFEQVKDEKIPLFIDDKIEKISVGAAVEKGIIGNEALAYYMLLTYKFLMACGINGDKIRFRQHRKDELAHYARECWDAEIYSDRFGWIECVGIADRTAYDLESHIKHSGADLYAIKRLETPQEIEVEKIEVDMGKLGPLFKEKARVIREKLEKLDPSKFEEEIEVEVDGEKIKIPKDCYKIKRVKEKVNVERFIPHVIEPSYGIDRIFFHVLEHNYIETTKKGEEYRVLKLPYLIAPIKTGVFPLVSDERLCKIARNIHDTLRKNCIESYYDESGSIGRRYARMDEIGTPYCITVDFDTLEDNTVTIRDRDTTEQIRIKIEELVSFFKGKESESLYNILNY